MYVILHFLLAALIFNISVANDTCDENVPDFQSIADYVDLGWYYTLLLQSNEGWYRTPPGNWKIPMISPQNDFVGSYWSYSVLTEALPASLGAEAKELQMCIVQTSDSLNCMAYSILKIRICEGGTQYYLPSVDWDENWTPYIFVPSDVEFLPPGLIVSVHPELVYSIEESEGSQLHTPVLQFNCIPETNETLNYKVSWYLENVPIKQVGPSSNTKDLVLTEHDIELDNLGYKVSCGVVVVNETSESNETLSTPFYAGFTVTTKDIIVSKGGFKTVEVRQTVPIGCTYSDGDTSACSTTLALYDHNLSENPCDAGITAVNADNDDMCVNEILTQKETYVWESNPVYTFRVKTVDNNYDDPLDYGLRLELYNNDRHASWQGYVVENFHVSVAETEHYKNKMCYSHVDPHMRTCDGNYYENQKEGYYMLIRHKGADVEVQEATKYCFGGNSGPVCTCGIAVRAGKDVFMINRCGSINLLDFLRCEDGGIIQVERINDYKYKIVTPTGTQIFANLLGGYYQNTMNIDIIISAKDFGETEGLCGLCDGDRFNDFVRKDGTTSSNNYDYTFSDSWRLSVTENLFITSERVLEGWEIRNEVTCRCVDGICTAQKRRECGRTVESITKTKCDIRNRKKRALGDYKHQKEMDRLYALMLTPRRRITKRSTVETSVTAEVANSKCSESIYSAPSVIKFPNKTAGEDLGELMNQCVYDVTESNDTSWASVHADAINAIAKNILELNPVYVANNTDDVEIFLTQTCLNNCTGNGNCLETGECNCTGNYRGPDCSFDIRDPVIIEDVEGGGVCDRTDSSDCSCFTIRTSNIFKGFYCQTTITRIQNSSQEIVLIENSKQYGAHEDIFTGTCCITEEENSLSAVNDFVHVYKFSASNDGNNFGEPQNVYVYDSTCHEVFINETITDISLKDGYCFIDNQCHEDGELSYTGCLFCNSSVTAYNWTEYNQCVNDGACVFQDNEYKCNCADGYEGINCEIDIDECLSIPCQHNSTCVDAVNGYTCNCSDGYDGENCETDIDDCVSAPCNVGGICIDHVNGFSCNCSVGFTGNLCETNINECVSQPCENGGICEDQINGYSCACASGYEGTTCSTEIDECEPNPCQHGVCKDNINGYICTCLNGYEGTNCELDIDECESEPCQHGSTCINQVNNYMCICPEGYNGTNCESDINECISNPCQNEAECTDDVNGYTCTCTAGYEGINCELDTDECLSNPCQNGANCTDEFNGYTCTCVAGYEGSICETDTNECSSSPCKNGASCADKVNGYTCICVDGYEGTNCEIDIDECESEPCQHGSTCVNQVNNYMCICPEGYNGTNCESDINECISNPCQNEAECTDDVNGYTCTCTAGYEGINCELDTDECLSNPCQNGANCTDEFNGYTCTCVAGYEGSICETDTNECSSSPCKNGASCADKVNGYTCICVDGYEGTHCEIDINECSSSPCKNGASCTDKVNGYTCICVDGYEGTNCEIGIDCFQNFFVCVPNPCQNGASCIDKVNSYKCTCAEGYEGSNCETEINECLSNPCENGANCTDGVNEYICTCAEGYGGIRCETDTNECQSSPCQNGGSCADEVNGYTCTCSGGYEGTNCEIDTNECQSSPCLNGGNCTDEVNGYTCTCSDGYEGTNCETDTNECQSRPCQNGGSCTDEVNGYICTCSKGYEGTNCETDTNECQSSPCQNGGSCTDEVNGYTCRCSEGYEGTNCETDTNECQSSPCKNGGTCTDEVNGYTCTCSNGYEGTNCEIAITTSTTTTQSSTVPLKSVLMRIVFSIDVTDIDLASSTVQRNIIEEVATFFIDIIGNSFKQISNVIFSRGSLVIDFVAEFENSQQSSRDFTKATVDLVNGDKTVELFNRTVSATSVRVNELTVSAETVQSENTICEIFLTINGDCPASQHCSLNSTIPDCVEIEDPSKFGLTFVVIMILCSFAAFILLAFIICFSVRGYRLKHQTRKHANGSIISSKEESVWPYRNNIPAYNRSWFNQNKSIGFLSYQREFDSEGHQQANSQQSSYSRGSTFQNIKFSRQFHGDMPGSYRQVYENEA